MSQTITDNLAQFIAADILKQPGRPIPSGEPLISSGLIDSFSLVDLALYIEKNFNVHIDDTELNAETFDSLEQLVNLINARHIQEN